MTWDAPAAWLREAVAMFDAMARGELQYALSERLRARGQELLLYTWEEQAAPDGTPWASPARDYGHPLLDKTGEMKSSARVELGPRIDATGFSITFTVADPKAIWHQYGTHRGGPTTSPLRAQNRKSYRAGESERLHIPARPMLFSDESTAARWIEDLEQLAIAFVGEWMTARIS